MTPESNISYRLATDSDYEWVFNLKVAAEKQYVEAVFGWDESLQRRLHQQEWAEARPTCILLESQPAGTCLLQQRDSDYYFGRFFLLPEFQGRGIGSQVLRHICCQLDAREAHCELKLLQGNRVASLYHRFGFRLCHQDRAFITMRRPPCPAPGDQYDQLSA